MKIGLLSDTHGYLDPRVKDWVSDCDEIWHAGDIGSIGVAEEMTSWGKQTRIVFGNIDDPDIRQRFPEDLWFTCEGMKVWITHIAGSPPRYNARVRHLLQHEKPGILVCGHSHILKVIHDKTFPVLYLNPGAAGNHGFHSIRTMLRFEINGSKAERMEVIEMGKRGMLS
jgi:uncharacterized protein